MIRKSILFLLMISMAGLANAQYIPAFRPDSIEKKDAGKEYWDAGNFFKHMEVSLSLGTTGIGIDVAAPICEYFQVRLGFDYMLPFKKNYKLLMAANGEAARQYDEKGNRKVTNFNKIADYIYNESGYELDDYINMTGKLTMKNLKLLFDIYPLEYNKHLHATLGVYWGPEEFYRMDKGDGADVTLSYMSSYNSKYEAASADDEIKSYGKLDLYPGDYDHDFNSGGKMHKKGEPYLMQPADDGSVVIHSKSWSIKPYVGVGYTGRLVKKRDDWKISAELGALFWGGTPLQQTQDGTDLSTKVCNIKGSLGHRIALIEALTVYPVLNFRIAKTLF